ncbi:MAG: PAS domain S-box protein [SAR324 cluster bacterium]|nr:PAS domain S-box protein [SAR324 cluster bacterium]
MDQFFNISRDLMCVINVDGNITQWNDSWCQTLNRAMDELHLRPFIDCVHVDDRPMTLWELNLLFDRDEGTQCFNNRLTGKDGTIFWFSWNFSLHTQERQIYAIGRDITKQILMEQELRSSEARFRSIFNTAPDGIVTIDDQGYIKSVNPAALRLFGYSEKTLLGQHVKILMPPRFQETHESSFKHYLITGRPRVIGLGKEAMGLRINGDEFPIRLSVAEIWGDEQRQFVGIVHDITDLKQTEAALRESEERYTRLSELTHEGIILHSNGIIIDVNTTFCRMLGYERHELIETSYLKLVAPQSIDTLNHNIALRSSESYEAILLRKDGTTFPAEIIGKNTNWKDQDLRVASVLDITYRIQAEAEKLKLENQLRQSQKMEALGTMAGGIAHDFNNLLFAILGNIELSQEFLEEDHEILPYLQQATKAGIRAKELIRQILTFSRQQDAAKIPMDIRILLKEITVFLRSSLPSTIEIKSNIANTSYMIFADPTQLHQVILNLSVNAEYAMREQGGTLTIELSEISLALEEALQLNLLAGQYLKLTITDTGTGIPREYLDRIFDPFFTTKPVGQGTGLGLSVVLGIIKKLGGGIQIESEMGKGTSFYLFFPVLSVSETQPQTSEQEVVPVTGIGHILLIDDELSIREMTHSILQRLGYVVTCTDNGEEAIDWIRRNPDRFDLVLTDQTMPQITGLELARQIHAMKLTMPVILMTGFSYAIEEQSLKEHGISAFLQKPFTMQKLSETIFQLMHHSQSESEKS